MSQTVLDHDIVGYYDDCHVDYQIVWHVNSRMCMHYGYWDENTPNLRTALENMNRQVASAADVKPGCTVLDAGCGVGGSSIFLASQYNCRVEGITLSGKQAETATENSEKFNLGDRVRFSVDSYTESSFPDNHFDLVWAIESVCHAEEKMDFLREAYRVLKPGGQFIVADFFRPGEPTDHDPTDWIGKWADSWAVPDFEPMDLFAKKAVGAGFKDIRTDDITTHIARTAKRLYYCFYPGILCDGALRLIGRRNPRNKKNVWSCLYQYKSLKAGQWKYYLVNGQKPFYH